MGYQSPAAPNLERIQAIASSARAWVVSLLGNIPAQGDIAARALCHGLIATWIADTMADNDRAQSAGFAEVAQSVARSLNAFENSDHLDSVKPTLKLLVAVLLSSEGLEVEPFGQFLSQSASIFRRADALLDADPALMEKRILLYSAGVLPRPPAATADGVRVLLNDFRLCASAEVIDALALELECLTGWGTRQVGGEVDAPSLGEILAGFAVHRLRNYDLASAARLVRLQEYLDTDRRIVRRDDLYHAICMHHRAHGPFGWYGPEAAKLRKQSPATPEDTEFYLVATLECLWTLAERSVDGWRLFGKLPQYRLPKN
jgi:hypothetical protein